MITLKSDCDKIPEFDICYDSINADWKDGVLIGNSIYFNKVEYTMNIYRMPGHIIMTVFIPLLIISSFILSLFTVTLIWESILPNLATLFLALIAFLPTVRAEIPTVSYITFTDGIIYSLLFQCIFFIMHVVLVQYFEVQDRNYFIYLAVLTFLVPFFRTIVYLIDYQSKKRRYDDKNIYLKRNDNNNNIARTDSITT